MYRYTFALSQMWVVSFVWPEILHVEPKRHLLKRIEEPMKQFESNQNVLAGKDAKRIIKVRFLALIARCHNPSEP